MTLAVGQTVFWDDHEGLCSGWVTITKLDGECVTVSRDGTEFDVFAAELDDLGVANER